MFHFCLLNGLHRIDCQLLDNEHSTTDITHKTYITTLINQHNLIVITSVGLVWSGSGLHHAAPGLTGTWSPGLTLATGHSQHTGNKLLSPIYLNFTHDDIKSLDLAR